MSAYTLLSHLAIPATYSGSSLKAFQNFFWVFFLCRNSSMATSHFSFLEHEYPYFLNLNFFLNNNQQRWSTLQPVCLELLLTVYPQALGKLSGSKEFASRLFVQCQHVKNGTDRRIVSKFAPAFSWHRLFV